MKILDDEDFELNVNPVDGNTQHLFKLSDIRQMPLHKCKSIIWCALSGQGERGRHAAR